MLQIYSFGKFLKTIHSSLPAYKHKKWMWIWLFHSVPWYMYKSMRFRNVRWLLNDNALNLIILCFVSVDLTWMGTLFCITAFLLTFLFVSYSKHAQSFSIYKVVLYLIHDMLVQESNKSILLFTKIRKWPKRITLSETYIPYFQWFHEAQYSVSRKIFNLQYKQFFIIVQHTCDFNNQNIYRNPK